MYIDIFINHNLKLSVANSVISALDTVPNADILMFLFARTSLELTRLVRHEGDR